MTVTMTVLEANELTDTGDSVTMTVLFSRFGGVVTCDNPACDAEWAIAADEQCVILRDEEGLLAYIYHKECFNYLRPAVYAAKVAEIDAMLAAKAA